MLSYVFDISDFPASFYAYRFVNYLLQNIRMYNKFMFYDNVR